MKISITDHKEKQGLKNPNSSKISTYSTSERNDLDFSSLSENNKRQYIISECKEIYLNAVAAKDYASFNKAVYEPLYDITREFEDIGCEGLYARSFFAKRHTLSASSIFKVINKKDKKDIESNWSFHFSSHLENFINDRKDLTIYIYRDFEDHHSSLCIMERQSENKIRLTLVDSIGVPYIDRDKCYGGYIGSLSSPVFKEANKNKDIEFEIGLLKITSQYDKTHCNAWLAEFIRKTKCFSNLTNQLWKNSSIINEQLISEIFELKDYVYNRNLKCCFLEKLPLRYMMSVQNPRIIREYLDNYEFGDDTIKLKHLLDKEILTGLKHKGKEIDTNIHLERKSLKYVIEGIAEELGLYGQELRLFFRKNSPYHELEK